MKKTSEISAVKTLENDSEIIFEGSVADLRKGALKSLLPIGRKDRLIIDISDDIDPLEVASYLSFEAGIENSPDEGKFEEWLLDVAYDGSLSEEDWLVSVAAFLRKGDVTWQIAGLNSGAEIVPVLVNQEEFYYPSARYLVTRTLAAFDYHSDGPGPISWDMSGALSEMGDYLLASNGGDSETEDEIWQKQGGISSALSYWLEENGGLAFFILQNAPLVWGDEKLREAYASGLADLEDFMGLQTKLTEEEIAEILLYISNTFPQAKELINILASEKPREAQILIDIFKEAADSVYPGPLTQIERLIEELQAN
jgi:hypothetical protein